MPVCTYRRRAAGCEGEVQQYEQSYEAFGQPATSRVWLCFKHFEKASEAIQKTPVKGRGPLVLIARGRGNG